MRNRGHVSSEAFPLNLELFLSGGAGAPPAPLAETPMYGCLCYCALPRLNVHNIPPYRTTAAEAFISSSAVVQEGSPKDQ